MLVKTPEEIQKMRMAGRLAASVLEIIEPYTVVREFGGHGIGKEMWEEPHVPHFGKPNTGLALYSGMTFTIEPMINLGKKDIRHLPDGWTVITKDHKLSAQWEHTILVTDNGCEVLTPREEEEI